MRSASQGTKPQLTAQQTPDQIEERTSAPHSTPGRPILRAPPMEGRRWPESQPFRRLRQWAGLCPITRLQLEGPRALSEGCPSGWGEGGRSDGCKQGELKKFPCGYLKVSGANRALRHPLPSPRCCGHIRAPRATYIPPPALPFFFDAPTLVGESAP